MSKKSEVDLNMFSDEEILRLRLGSLNHIRYLLDCMVDFAKGADIGEVSEMVTELRAYIIDFWLYDTECFDRRLNDGEED